MAAVIFTLVGIGSPLLGLSVFAATDEISGRSPYYDFGLAGTVIQNTFMDDTYDAELPAELLFSESVRDGDPAAWNPYVSGGTPLGAVPNGGLFSPLALPYYVMPGWLAPAYAKLLEIALAIGGCYLFLRRLRLRPPAALLGGVVFASSAFMVMWTNWPQTRVAAFIPWVFWGAERLVQRRRVADAVILALPVAAMLFGGFPAVTAFTVATAGVYVVVRAVAEHGRAGLRPVLAAAGALAGALALAAVQLVPFSVFYRSWLIEGRAQTPGEHLTLDELATLFAPWTYGGVSLRTDQPYWYLEHNMVEASSYVGAAALVLIVVCVALVRAGRAMLPRGAWVVLIASAGFWLVLVYIGGPLRFMQELPVFGNNFVGRARSILGFLLAVLAAVGLELLLRRAPVRRRSTGRFVEGRAVIVIDWGRRWGVAWGVAVCVAATAGVGLLVMRARSAAAAADATHGGIDRLGYANAELVVGLALMAAAAGAAVVLMRTGVPSRGTPIPRTTEVARFGAAGLLIVLVVGQGLSYVGPYWPRVDRATFFPTTDTHDFLAANLGHERYIGTNSAMYMGLDPHRRMRALSGHSFLNAEFAALVRAVPGDPVDYATHILFLADPAQAASPILDRLAGRYFVTSPRDGVFGVTRSTHADGTMASLAPGRSVSAPVPSVGPIRGVGFTPGTAPVAGPDSWIDVVVTDATGARVATGRRLTAGMVIGQPFFVPVAGEDAPADAALTVAITAHTDAPIAVTATAGRPAISSVVPRRDGLRLAYAGSAVVYQRLTALPRIRWASRTVVQRDRDRRIQLLAEGKVDPDQVLLSGSGPAAAGRPATVDVTEDGTDVVAARVDAQGAGYLVVADALQTGWSATVDGRPARLMPADQGVVAVAVGAGSHTVELRYHAPYRGAGRWLSLAALLTAVVLLVVDRRRYRRGAAFAHTGDQG